ncbi:protein of unknown function DUF5102 [Metschnikowia aff. pulcherrima]|uniref:Uncharacterized protein n=1 Tax=Metschnikowia aff. pulcherrima TaxID=2163413 RepID=A0A4P6XU98_9ASCO|nr:protein of unknown function DUF5102 [Metschnikowia aff. pulcherrima]
MGKGKKGKKGGVPKSPKKDFAEINDHVPSTTNETLSTIVDETARLEVTNTEGITDEQSHDEVGESNNSENTNDLESTEETKELNYMEEIPHGADHAEIPPMRDDPEESAENIVLIDTRTSSEDLAHDRDDSEEESPIHANISDDEDDFGSFDEASFEELEASTGHVNDPQPLSGQDEENSKLTPAKIQRTLDLIFPGKLPEQPSQSGPLLSKNAHAHFLELSKPPRLHPPNWTKLKLRHNLLLKLGIPINLDELSSSNSTTTSMKLETVRRKSISESDLDWSGFEIPEIESLNLSREEQQKIIDSTHETLSRIETDNMENTSELYLQKCAPDVLDSKLAQMKENYDQLIRLSSLWQGQLDDLKNSQNAFESVVQSMVGYNQKIQRNELLESLRRSKTKRGKKTF